MINVEMCTWEALFVIFGLFSVIHYVILRTFMMDHFMKFLKSDISFDVCIGFVTICSGAALILRDSLGTGMLEPLALFVKLLLLLVAAETVSVKIPVKVFSFCRRMLAKKTC